MRSAFHVLICGFIASKSLSADEIADLTVALRSQSEPARLAAVAKLADKAKTKKFPDDTLKLLVQKTRTTSSLELATKATEILANYAETHRFSSEIISEISNVFGHKQSSGLRNATKLLATISKKQTLPDSILFTMSIHTEQGDALLRADIVAAIGEISAHQKIPNSVLNLLIADLRAKDPEIRQEAMETLATIDRRHSLSLEMTEAIAKNLSRPVLDNELYSWITQFLVVKSKKTQLPRPVLDYLMSVLQGKDFDRRRETIPALAKIFQNQMIDNKDVIQLIGQLTSEASTEANAALRALSDHQGLHSGLVTAIAKRLEVQRVPHETQIRILELLHFLGKKDPLPKAALEALRGASKSRIKAIREVASSILTDLEENPHPPLPDLTTLLKRIQSSHSEVRLRSLKELEDIASEYILPQDALDLLQDKLEGKIESTKVASLKVLARASTKRQLSPSMLRSVVKLTNQYDRDVRTSALEVLVSLPVKTPFHDSIFGWIETTIAEDRRHFPETLKAWGEIARRQPLPESLMWGLIDRVKKDPNIVSEVLNKSSSVSDFFQRSGILLLKGQLQISDVLRLRSKLEAKVCAPRLSGLAKPAF